MYALMMLCSNLRSHSLREKCPNTELFFVKNAGKYGPVKTPNLDTFYPVIIYNPFPFNGIPKKDMGKYSRANTKFSHWYDDTNLSIISTLLKLSFL